MSPEEEAVSAVRAAMGRERKLLSDALEDVKRQRTAFRQSLADLAAAVLTDHGEREQAISARLNRRIESAKRLLRTVEDARA